MHITFVTASNRVTHKTYVTAKACREIDHRPQLSMAQGMCSLRHRRLQHVSKNLCKRLSSASSRGSPPLDLVCFWVGIPAHHKPLLCLLAHHSIAYQHVSSCYQHDCRRTNRPHESTSSHVHGSAWLCVWVGLSVGEGVCRRSFWRKNGVSDFVGFMFVGVTPFSYSV